jgi:DNA-binding response OmpR family regulator
MTEASGDQLTVLYIEDDPSNVRLVERVMGHRPGVKLITAMRGRLGVELARLHEPDLILLDLHLPDLPGEDVLTELRADARTAAISVVIVSADATAGQIERLRARDVTDYLTKPFEIARLLAVVDAAAEPAARR